MEATYGDNFHTDEGVEHDFSSGSYIISVNAIDRNVTHKEKFFRRRRVMESIEQ